MSSPRNRSRSRRQPRQPAPDPPRQPPRGKGNGEAFMWGLFLSLIGVVIVGVMSKDFRGDISPIWTALLGALVFFIFWPIVLAVCGVGLAGIFVGID